MKIIIFCLDIIFGIFFFLMFIVVYVAYEYSKPIESDEDIKLIQREKEKEHVDFEIK